jgi:hypothetical protein
MAGVTSVSPRPVAKAPAAPPQQTDPRALEMGRKVDELIKKRFGGDYQKAFAHYAKGGKEVSKEGVMQLLRDADVGFETPLGGTRDVYAGKVMDAFDTDHNKGISWSEFQNGLRGVGVNK